METGARGRKAKKDVDQKVSHGRYAVRYEPIEDGWWLAVVPDVPGCLTQGKSLRQARERIREALSLYATDANTAELIETKVLPRSVLNAVEKAQEYREAVEDAQLKASSASRVAVRALLKRGLSMRDAAELLEISHQRVAQLASEE